MKSIEITEQVRVTFTITGEYKIHKALLHLSKEGFAVKVKREDNEAYMSVIVYPERMAELCNIYRQYS